MPLAGCSGEENSDATTSEPKTEPTTQAPTTTKEPTEESTEEPTEEPEPASIQLDQYTTPNKVEIEEMFSIKVSVTNTGGQSTDFSAPLYMKSGDSTWSEQGQLDFGEVPPGETKQVTTNEFSFSYLNRYEIRLGDFSTTAVVQTVSSQFEWGGQYKTPKGYLVRVDEPELQDTYKYEDYMGDIQQKSPDNEGQWAFVNVRVENQTGSPNYSPMSSEFKIVSNQSQYDSKFLLSDPVDKGEKFEGGELQPGIVREGWIPYAIPSDLSVSDLTLSWSTTYYDGDVSVEWSSSD